MVTVLNLTRLPGHGNARFGSFSTVQRHGICPSIRPAYDLILTSKIVHTLEDDEIRLCWNGIGNPQFSHRERSARSAG